MDSLSVDPFPDNWTYLRAELNWLDRRLSVAVARQRKETKEIDRVAKNRADRVTSHWWKGLISLDTNIAYDAPVEGARRKADSASATSPAQNSISTPNSYPQQLEAKILSSQQHGIGLGLPLLVQRLHLSVFEKNLVLMVLAPEISRRYGRLYRYLQETDPPNVLGLSASGVPSSDLPTIDLVLRLLCRTDAEWRSGRQSLAAGSRLLEYNLLEIHTWQPESLLNRWLKLSDRLVNFLLSEQPNALSLESLLHRVPIAPVACLPVWIPSVCEPDWSKLVVSESIQQSLRYVCDRYRTLTQSFYGMKESEATRSNPIVESSAIVGSGAIVGLVGASGTGKTTAAQTIAQTLQIPLRSVDLALLTVAEQQQLLTEISTQTPALLLLKSAQVWLGRSSTLSEVEIRQFLWQRQQQPTITLLSWVPETSIRAVWQAQIQPILRFAFPTPNQRKQLWQQAFPADTLFDPAIDWQWLAKTWVLSGGTIAAIAREAVLAASTSPSNSPPANLVTSDPIAPAIAPITMQHLLQSYHFVTGR